MRILRPGGRLPERAHPGDAGQLPPGGRAPVGTGLAVAIPPGHAGLVLPRSGLARRHGVTLANSPGLIDAGYRGELVVTLVNLGDAPHRVEAGDRIAQLVLVPVELWAAREVGELPSSDGRGEGGFGSTG